MTSLNSNGGNDTTYNMGGSANNDAGTNASSPSYNFALNPNGVESISVGIFSDFPNHTTWTWTAGTTVDNGNPLGYPSLNYGYGYPQFNTEAHPPTPHHPLDSAFANVTLTINQSITISQVDSIDWLVESWSQTQAVPPQPPSRNYNTTAHEIGFYMYLPPSLVTFLQSGTHNFDATLSDGMNIRCYTVSGGSPLPFVTAFAVTTPGGNTVINLCDGKTHTIRFGEILGLMATHGAISNTEWIVGFDSGPEIYAGTGSGVCSIYQWNNWT